jgi:hypothetical protein
MSTLEKCARRVVLEVLIEQNTAYWRRRAEDFAAVGTDDCDEIARACWARARFAEMGGADSEFAELLDQELGEVSP